MTNDRLFRMPFSDLYPLYLAKVERKGRTATDLEAVVGWLTGYAGETIASLIDRRIDLECFFAEAPMAKTRTPLVAGKVCGVRVEDVADPTIRMIRAVDLLVDELAKGRPLSRILRS
ncbi:MAG: DUF2200 family protein [Candidatus Izemoplasmatales bacterium]